jgi:hypothetical protein
MPTRKPQDCQAVRYGPSADRTAQRFGIRWVGKVPRKLAAHVVSRFRALPVWRRGRRCWLAVSRRLDRNHGRFIFGSDAPVRHHRGNERGWHLGSGHHAHHCCALQGEIRSRPPARSFHAIDQLEQRRVIRELNGHTCRFKASAKGGRCPPARWPANPQSICCRRTESAEV